MIHYPFWGFPLSDEWGLLSFSIKSTLAFGSYIQENKNKMEAIDMLKVKETCTQSQDWMFGGSKSLCFHFYNI